LPLALVVLALLAVVLRLLVRLLLLFLLLTALLILLLEFLVLLLLVLLPVGVGLLALILFGLLVAARLLDPHLVVRALGDVLLREVAGVARPQPVLDHLPRLQRQWLALGVLQPSEVHGLLVVEDVRVAAGNIRVAAGQADLLVGAVRPRLDGRAV